MKHNIKQHILALCDRIHLARAWVQKKNISLSTKTFTSVHFTSCID